MADFIDRQALEIGKCDPKVFENKAYAEGWNSAISIIESAPAADVRPERHGLWLDSESPLTSSCKCSLCICYFESETPYCPNCGAKMDGKEINDGK